MELTNKQRYLIELEDIAGSYDGLREFNCLREEDYLRIGYAFVQNDAHDFIIWIEQHPKKTDEYLSDTIIALNDLCSGSKDLIDCKNDLEKTYHSWLVEFIENNRDIEFEYDQAKAEAYAEHLRNPDQNGGE